MTPFLSYNEKLIADFDSEKVLLESLIKILDEMESVTVSSERAERVGQVKALLELLQTPSPEDRVKINALDVGRVHEETLTLRVVLMKMLEDQENQRILIKKQESHDESEVTRLTKIVHEAEIVERSKYSIQAKLQHDFDAASKKCVEASSKYSEFSKVALEHGKSTLKRIGIINHEISILNEMRVHIEENMSSIQKYEVTKEKLGRVSEEMAHQAEKMESSMLSEDKKEALLLKRQAEEAQAEVRKHREENAEFDKEAKEAEEAAAHAEEEAMKRQERLEKEAEVAKMVESKKKYLEKLARAKAAKEQLERKKKMMLCISIAEKVTENLLGVRYTPNFIIKQCSAMTGNEEALSAGVTRLVKVCALSPLSPFW